GIKVHTRQWSLEDAQRCFEQEAYVAAPAARREAESATYDPTYGGYFLGKRGILKLRADYGKRMGPKFSLREFHERFMTNGIAPIWAHRQLLLPGDTGAGIEGPQVAVSRGGRAVVSACLGRGRGQSLRTFPATGAIPAASSWPSRTRFSSAR